MFSHRKSRRLSDSDKSVATRSFWRSLRNMSPIINFPKQFLGTFDVKVREFRRLQSREGSCVCLVSSYPCTGDHTGQLRVRLSHAPRSPSSRTRSRLFAVTITLKAPSSEYCLLLPLPLSLKCIPPDERLQPAGSFRGKEVGSHISTQE